MLFRSIGSKVTKFNKGDRVVINPTVSNREKEENIDLYDDYMDRLTDNLRCH